MQVINKKSYHDDGDTFTLDGIFHDEDEIIIESLCQHLRLAFETCGGDRTEESFQKKTSIVQTKNKTISTTSTTGSKNTDGGSNGESGESGSKSGSNTVVDTEDLAMLSLSTEALLRFELKHRATGDQRQSNVGTLECKLCPYFFLIFFSIKFYILILLTNILIPIENFCYLFF